MTGARPHMLPLLFGVFVVGVPPALAQTRLTADEIFERSSP